MLYASEMSSDIVKEKPSARVKRKPLPPRQRGFHVDKKKWAWANEMGVEQSEIRSRKSSLR